MSQENWVQRVGGARANRSRHEWSDMLPIMLRSAVHGEMTVGRFREPWSKRLVLIKWVIQGKASMVANGRRVPFGPGEVAIHLPTQPHAFWSEVPGTHLCWFSVDGSLAEQFVHSLGLRSGVFPYGPAPVKEVGELIDSLSDQSIAGCRQSSMLAVKMLYDVIAKLPPPEQTSIVYQVRHHIREGLSDSQLSAKRLATQLNYSRGALSRAFHKQAGMTIMECITQTRLQEAEMLLTSTEERISDIARKCGFSDASYFTRWIRKHTKRLPGELRGKRILAQADVLHRAEGS